MLCPSLLEESKSIQESKVDIALFDKPVVNVCDLLRIVLVQLGHPHAENLKMSQMLNCDYVIEYIISWNLLKEIQCRYAFTFALSDLSNFATKTCLFK